MVRLKTFKSKRLIFLFLFFKISLIFALSSCLSKSIISLSLRNLISLSLRNPDDVKELTFIDAVDILQCTENTEKKHFQKDYYDLLAINKFAFEHATSDDIDINLHKGRGGKSNIKFILQLLKSNEIKHFDGYTDEEEEYIQLAKKAFQESIIPQNTAKKIANAIKKEITSKSTHPALKLLGILKRNIPDVLLMPEQTGQGSQYFAKREVILSEYLVGE